LDPPGKKPAAAIHPEVAREVNAWLTRLFAERRQTEATDLEAVEMGLRTTPHQGGAKLLQHILPSDEPAPDRRPLPCSCGQQARYVELRSKSLLPVRGKAERTRPYYRGSGVAA
jgi:hypothetical protein